MLRNTRSPLFLIAVASSVTLLVGCHQEQATITQPPQGTVPGASARTVVNGTLDGAPGECTYTIPVVQDGDGSLAETSTNCSVSDSTFVAIRVRGKLQSSPNPDASWCVPGASGSAVGFYGPMGGGSSADWMRLLVTVRGVSTTAGTFSIPARDTATGASIFFGSPAEVVAYGDGYFIGKGSTLLRVLRSGNQDTVSCTGPLAPQPPGCANGGARACGPINKYRVNGTQVLTVKPTRVTLVVNAAPTPIYEGDTVTFTASSTDGRLVSVRSWVWQDSAGATANVGCSLSGTSCKFAPSGSGRMFVRGRVGNNPFIEQATTSVTSLPLELHLVAAPPYALSGDTSTIFAVTSPVGRLITGFDIVAGAGGSKAWCMDGACGAVVSASASFSGSALVNGRLKTASVAITVLPPCETAFRALRRNVSASEAAPACIKTVPCDADLDSSCLQPLTHNDSLILAEITQYKRPSLSIADSATRVWCDSAFNSYTRAFQSGNVFRGKSDGSLRTEHLGATLNNRKIHIEPGVLKAATYPLPGSAFARRLLLNVLMHEGLHTVGQMHPGNGVYTGTPFQYTVYVRGTGVSACVM